MKEVDAKEVVVSDLLDETTLDQAFFGTTEIYHICPNMHPQEVEIGQLMIQLAQKNHLKRFVYHSVLHPEEGYSQTTEILQSACPLPHQEQKWNSRH